MGCCSQFLTGHEIWPREDILNFPFIWLGIHQLRPWEFMLYTRQGFLNHNGGTGEFVFTFRYLFLPATITKPALDTFPVPRFTLKTQLRILTQTELITSMDHMILWRRQKENTAHFQFSMRLLGPHLSSNHSPSN